MTEFFRKSSVKNSVVRHKTSSFLVKFIDLSQFPKTKKFKDLVSAIQVHIEHMNPFDFRFSNAKNYRIKLINVFVSIDGKKLTVYYEQTKIVGTQDLDLEFLLTTETDNICLMLKDIEHETYKRSHPIIEYPSF